MDSGKNKYSDLLDGLLFSFLITILPIFLLHLYLPLLEKSYPGNTTLILVFTEIFIGLIMYLFYSSGFKVNPRKVVSNIKRDLIVPISKKWSLVFKVYLVGIIFFISIYSYFRLQGPFENELANFNTGSLLVYLLIAPIVEELTFRAGIRSYLLKFKFGDVSYVLISSILFSLIHFTGGQEILKLTWLAIVGAFFAIIYLVKKDVKFSIFAHSVYNLLIISLTLLI